MTTERVGEARRMWTQPKKSKQYDRMGDILMNSDFKKSLTKAMLKGRKQVYCWESRLKKKKKTLKCQREGRINKVLLCCYFLHHEIISSSWKDE